MNDRTILSHHTVFTRSLLAGTTLMVAVGCAGTPDAPPKTIYESGRNQVRIVKDSDSTSNTHPANLTPAEVGTLLRSVRSWEQRNFIHRLYSGEADKTRAFRNEEIAVLAPPLSKALAQAAPDERVYFHLSHATEQGDEESTTGWLSIRQETLYLSLSEVHDRHGPEPDISKYDRQMPNVPERSTGFEVTFEPEEYLIKVKSRGSIFAPDQREELQIKYRDALGTLPTYPGLEPRTQNRP
ncbi:MAG TPA: hypothetical protein VH332_07870 [Nitrospira sp.]